MRPLELGLITLLLATAAAGCGPRVLFQRPDPVLGSVWVIEEHGVRTLRFGGPRGDEQSAIDPRRPEHEPYDYLRAALVALAYPTSPRRLLMIGLGGGSYLRHAHHLAPALRLEAVEISAAVVEAARRHFLLVPEVEVHVADGRRFVEGTAPGYDLVFLDAYGAVDYPRHLGTVEFFAAVRGLVAPGGVAVANIVADADQLRDDLVATFRAVFPAAHCLASPSGNTLLIGVLGALPDEATLGRRLAALDRASAGRYGLAAAFVRRCLDEGRAGRRLRDPPP